MFEKNLTKGNKEKKTVGLTSKVFKSPKTFMVKKSFGK